LNTSLLTTSKEEAVEANTHNATTTALGIAARIHPQRPSTINTISTTRHLTNTISSPTTYHSTTTPYPDSITNADTGILRP
jgi:hypothetical protein